MHQCAIIQNRISKVHKNHRVGDSVIGYYFMLWILLEGTFYLLYFRMYKDSSENLVNSIFDQDENAFICYQITEI